MYAVFFAKETTPTFLSLRGTRFAKHQPARRRIDMALSNNKLLTNNIFNSRLLKEIGGVGGWQFGG